MRNLLLIAGAIIFAIAGYLLFMNYTGLAVVPNEPAREDAQLVGTEWVWTHTEVSQGETVNAPAGERFVLTFEGGSQVSSTTDCNGLGGQYVQDGEVLSMGQFISTLMYCEGSLESVYSSQLALVNSYIIEGTKLQLNLNRDYGTMYFEGR